ncbi:MAG TPA: hypothetical protein DCM40_16305 [Maribacter sp.]|nr:hypothetical protein [Maribacter sp.]
MKYLCILFGLMYASIVQPDIYGSRASFLLHNDVRNWMSLSYLSSNVDDAWRRRVENALINQGDTHIYIYSHNENDGIGNVLPQSDWELRLDHLNSRGLRPVMWLMADDSPNLASKPLSYHKSHNSEMVSRFDDKVDGYVIGLEVDEYWSAEQVKEMVDDLKTKTNKPVGVHLSPGIKLAYLENADIIYLQTGFNLNESQFRAKVTEALSLGKPVIVSEYHMDSSSTVAKRYGDIACEMGAVGTGNGRNVESCGQRQTKKEKWYQKYGTEMVVGGVAMATLYAVSRYDLPFTIRATEETYQIGFQNPIGNHTVGIEYGNMRSMVTYGFRF